MRGACVACASAAPGVGISEAPSTSGAGGSSGGAGAGEHVQRATCTFLHATHAPTTASQPPRVSSPRAPAWCNPTPQNSIYSRGSRQRRRCPVKRHTGRRAASSVTPRRIPICTACGGLAARLCAGRCVSADSMSMRRKSPTRRKTTTLRRTRMRMRMRTLTRRATMTTTAMATLRVRPRARRARSARCACRRGLAGG